MKTGWLLALLFGISGSFCAAKLQERTKPLNSQSRVRTFSGIFPALDALSASYKIRFGLEVFDDRSDRGTVSLDFSEGNIPQILDELVKQRPEYEWSLDGDVYNVYPTEATRRLCDLNIALYYVRDATADENSDALDQLPELREWLALHKVRRSELLTGRRSESERKISLNLRAITFRSVLNETTKALGDPHWMILHYGDHMQFVGIYF